MKNENLVFPQDFCQFVDQSGCFTETVEPSQLAFFISKLKRLLAKVQHEEVETSTDAYATNYVISTNPKHNFYNFDGNLVIRVNLIDGKEVEIELTQDKSLFFDGESFEGKWIKNILKKMDQRLSFGRLGIERTFADLQDDDIVYSVIFCEDGIPLISEHEVKVENNVIKTGVYPIEIKDKGGETEIWHNRQVAICMNRQQAEEIAENDLNYLEKRISHVRQSFFSNTKTKK